MHLHHKDTATPYDQFHQDNLSGRRKLNTSSNTMQAMNSQMENDLLTLGQSVLASQPFSDNLGTKLARLEHGYAELHLPVHPWMQQQHGYAHGGVVSYLADNALTFAGGSMMGDSVTVELKIKLPAPGRWSSTEGKSPCLLRRQNIAVCTCEVICLDEQGEKVCAMAQGTINRRT